jgi:hypothetical protein
MKRGDKFLMDHYSGILKVVNLIGDNVKMLDDTGAEYLFSKKKFSTFVVAQIRERAPREAMSVGDVVFDRYNCLSLCTILTNNGANVTVVHHSNESISAVRKEYLIDDISVEIGDKYTKGGTKTWEVKKIVKKTQTHPTIIKMQCGDQFSSPFLHVLHSDMRRIIETPPFTPIHKEIVIALGGNKAENVPLKMKFDAIDRGEKHIRRILAAWPTHKQLRHKFIIESDILKCAWFWEDIPE